MLPTVLLVTQMCLSFVITYLLTLTLKVEQVAIIICLSAWHHDYLPHAYNCAGQGKE